MANKGSVNYLTFVFGLHELFFSLEGGGLDSQCCLSGVRNLLNSRSRDGFYQELKGWGGVWAQPLANFFIYMLFYVFYIIFFINICNFNNFLSFFAHDFLAFSLVFGLQGGGDMPTEGHPPLLATSLFVPLSN